MQKKEFSFIVVSTNVTKKRINYLSFIEKNHVLSMGGRMNFLLDIISVFIAKAAMNNEVYKTGFTLQAYPTFQVKRLQGKGLKKNSVALSNLF